MAYHIGSSKDGSFYSFIMLYDEHAAPDERKVNEEDVNLLTAKLDEMRRLLQRTFGSEFFDYEVDRKAKNYLKEPIPHIEFKWRFKEIENVAKNHVEKVTGLKKRQINDSDFEEMVQASQRYFNKECNHLIESIVKGEELGFKQASSMVVFGAESIKARLLDSHTHESALGTASRLLEAGYGFQL